MGNETVSRRALRHRALWEARDARLAKLLFATLLFGGLATWKVTRPSLAWSREHAEAAQAQIDAEVALATLEPQKRELAAVVAALEQARCAIEAAPWNDVVVDLQRGLAGLREARANQRRDPAAAHRYFIERNEAGEGAPNSPPAPWEQRAPETSQIPPVRPLPVDPALPLDDQLARARDDAPYAPLTIDPEAAKNANETNFTRLFEAALDQAASELLERTIATIIGAVEQSVRQPLEQALAGASRFAAALTPLGTALAELSARLDRWRSDHLEDREWLATPDEKRQEVASLGAIVAAWRSALEAQIAPIRANLEQSVATATAAVAELSSRRTELAASQKRLSAAVADLLPSWIRSFVTAEELLRALPLVLTLLGTLIATGALLVRHHHRSCRAELFPELPARRDPAVTSCWTLADRGALGTLSSSLAWMTVTAIWWWTTRDALDSAQASWNSTFFAPPPFPSEWLALASVALVLLPVMAFVGIVAAWIDHFRER